MDIDSAHQSQQIPLVAVEDIVGTRDNGLVLRGGSLPVGIGQPLNIQVVVDKEAAYGVGDAGDDLVPKSADIVAALHGLGDIVLGIDPLYGDIFIGHLVDRLVLETVDVNENAV